LLFGGFGLAIYLGLYHLLARERSVTITADLDGYVAAVERHKAPITRGSSVAGTLLLLLGAGILAFVIAIAATVGTATKAGMHICSDADFSTFTRTCTKDDLVLTNAQATVAHYEAGRPDGSVLLMNTLHIQVSGDQSGLAVVTTANGTNAAYIYGTVAHMFADAGLALRPGSYSFTVVGGTATTQEDLGSTTLLITP